MLWSVVEPFKLTLGSFTILIVLLTILAPIFGWKRFKVLQIISVIAFVAFVPCCSLTMKVLDKSRFGYFEHANYSEVRDSHVERYLPPAATKIKIDKLLNGFRAQYLISEADLQSYVDGLWEKYGDRSSITRKDFNDDGATASKEELAQYFKKYGWTLPEKTIRYYSPVGDNGAGSTYYLDPQTGTVFQHAGYW